MTIRRDEINERYDAEDGRDKKEVEERRMVAMPEPGDVEDANTNPTRSTMLDVLQSLRGLKLF